LNTPSLRLEESNANLTLNFYIDRDIPLHQMQEFFVRSLTLGESLFWGLILGWDRR